MVAIGYTRVSTLDQAQEGISLSAQKAKVEAYAALHGLELHDVLSDEGLSGKALKLRPAASLLVQMVKKGTVTSIVIFKLDRLFRNTREALEFADLCRKKKVALHSITEKLDTDSAMGTFFLTMLAALGQLERQQTGERTKMALSHKKLQGEKTGGRVPFGFDAYVERDGARNVCKLTENPTEQAIIQDMLGWRSQGKSLRCIAHLLMRREIKTKEGKEIWRVGVISRILNRFEAV